MELKSVLFSVLLMTCLLAPVRSASILESNLEALRSVKGTVLDRAEAFAAKTTDTVVERTSSLLSSKSNMIKDLLTSKLNKILGVKGNIIKGVISSKKALISKIVDAIIDTKLSLIRPKDSGGPLKDEVKPVSVDPPASPQPQAEINNVIVELPPTKISPENPADCSTDCILKGIQIARRLSEERSNQNPVRARLYEVHRTPRVYVPYVALYGQNKK